MAFGFSQCQALCLCRSSIDLSTRFGIWTWTKCGGTALRGLIDYSPLLAAQSNGSLRSGQGNASRPRGRSRVAHRRGRSCPSLRPWRRHSARRPRADGRAVRAVPRRPFRGLVSGSRCPAASPRRRGATLIPEDIPAADSPWCCPCPWRPWLPVGGQSWRPRAGTDGDTDWGSCLDALTAALAVACHLESGRASQGNKAEIRSRGGQVAAGRRSLVVTPDMSTRNAPAGMSRGLRGPGCGWPHHRPVVVSVLCPCGDRQRV